MVAQVELDMTIILAGIGYFVQGVGVAYFLGRQVQKLHHVEKRLDRIDEHIQTCVMNGLRKP